VPQTVSDNFAAKVSKLQQWAYCTRDGGIVLNIFSLLRQGLNRPVTRRRLAP